MARKHIAIIDILDRTETAKLEAEWSVDHFHLAERNGRYVIMNAVCRTYPLESGG